MSLSPFLSITSLALALASCSDDGGKSCGTQGASDTGLLASSTDVTLTFGHMTSRAGNDCPAADAPDGVISLTIEGTQTDGTGFITFCIPRPDLLADGMQAIGLTSSTSAVRIIDLQGSAGSCTYAIDKTRPPTGTGGGNGVCANGTDKAGFALELDGAISLTRTCGSTTDSIAVRLTGTGAVAAE